MKKSLIISIFVFWLFATAILTAGLVFNQNKINSGIFSNGTSTISTGSISSTASQNTSLANLSSGQTLTLNLKEIAKHSSASDCWMIISGKVYNLTSFISVHPGGAGTILEYCGKDGTIGFQTKDSNTPHSQTAQNLLANYFIGNLNQTIGTKNIPKAFTVPKTTPVSVPVTIPVSTPSTTTPPIVTPPTTQNISLTSAEVSKHNNANDCWMIISGNVYNLTPYIPSHPGGSAILAYCGLDGTSAFLNGPPHAHSSFAQSLLSNYYVGALNTTVTAPTNTTTLPTQNTTSTTPFRNRGGEENDD